MKIEHKIGDKLTCPECGNQFIFDETCAYRTSDYVCSLNCFNKSMRRYYESKKALNTEVAEEKVETKLNPITNPKVIESTTTTKTVEEEVPTKKKRGRPAKSKE